MKDLRLIVVGTWRTGSTHIQRGDAAAGWKWCDEALALSSPIPFDEAMIRAVRGLGLEKIGDVRAGIGALEQSVAWFEQSNLWYARSVVGLWLADACLRDGDRVRARTLADAVLETSCRLGYRHVEGVAYRVIGQAMIDTSMEDAAHTLDRSIQVLEKAGAQNDLALAMLGRAEVFQRLGESPQAAGLLDTAISVFGRLGTIDALANARAARAALAGG
jgi:hypothetical protein